MDQSGRTENKKSRWFSVGKALGLDGGKSKRNDFEVKLKALDEVGKIRRKKEIDLLNRHCEDLNRRIKELKKAIRSDFKEVSEMSNGLINDLISYNLSDLKDNQTLYNKAHEIFTVRFDHLKQNCQKVLNAETNLENKIAEFEKSLLMMLNNINAGNTENIHDLEQSRKNFKELEEGYQYGFAIKTVLTEDTDKNK